MNNPDVMQIVDMYERNAEGHRHTMKNDPDGEAQSLSMLVKLLGRNPRKIAIVDRKDDRRVLAYHREDYEIIKMNGDRDTELRQFILRMEHDVQQARPKHVVVVSEDPQFVHLCNTVAPLTELAVWANTATAPRELKDPKYGWRPLEELLPNLKIPLIDVRLDLENIFIGLVQRGWSPDLHELIRAIHSATSDLGEVVTVTGYADFDELNRHHGGPKNVNWQRELTLAKAESRYVINQRGKNTADMKIVDDIRDLVERDPSSSANIDVIVLATGDRDFRTIVETAQRRGKKVVVLGLEGGVSNELKACTDVRYLNEFITLKPPTIASDHSASSVTRADVAFMMEIAAWMHQNRWRRVYRDRLAQKFGHVNERLEKLIADGWLTPTGDSPLDRQGTARALEPNPEKATAMAAYQLARWIPDRIHYCLEQRGMPHVDSNYLANGMARDTKLSQLGIAQTRTAAENWLHAAEAAGLVVSANQSHPQTPTKVIVTWRLPETPSPAAEEFAEVVSIAPVPSNAHLRELLTHGLSDAELTTLLFDHFLEVHRGIEGAPKFERIQALLDYVERRGQQHELLAAIRAVNPALTAQPEAMAIAA